MATRKAANPRTPRRRSKEAASKGVAPKPYTEGSLEPEADPAEQSGETERPKDTRQKVRRGKEHPAFSLTPPPGVIWRGPYLEGIRGSSFSKFLDCQDRFLKFIQGRKPSVGYRKQIYAGNLWHKAMDGPPATADKRMREYWQETLNDYPQNKNEINEFAKLIRSVFRVFIGYHNLPSPIETEFKFDVRLSKENPILLKGTMDGIVGSPGHEYIREIKCRGNLSNYETDRLPFSMQTMIYHCAFRRIFGRPAEGTEYHLIQRPLGNRDAPRFRKTKETKDEYHERVIQQYKDNPDEFMRVITCTITPEQIDEFEETFLIPEMARLGWWWTCLCNNNLRAAFHSRTPWGLYSCLRHWENNEYDDYYISGTEPPIDETLTSEDI